MINLISANTSTRVSTATPDAHPRIRSALTREPVVLLGGFEATISVMRSLARTGVPVDVLTGDVGLGTVMRHSRHCRRLVPAPHDNVQEEWLEWLLQNASHQGSVVLPCSDDGLELIANHRSTLTQWGYRTVPANDEVVLKMLNKERSYELARKIGISSPRTVVVTEVDEFEAAADKIGFPCAMKPIYKHHHAQALRWKAVRITDTSEASRRLVAQALQHGPQQFTEIVPGPEDQYFSYYTYIGDSGEPVFEVTKQKWRQYPVGFGDGTYHVSISDSEAADLGRRFCRGVGIRGLAVVEFKRDLDDGQLKLIECNPRFVGGNELMRVAGLDIAQLVYARAVGEDDPDMTRYEEGLTLWRPFKDLLAFTRLRRRREIGLALWFRQIARLHNFQIFSWSDPVPGLLTPLYRIPDLVRRGLPRS